MKRFTPGISHADKAGLSRWVVVSGENVLVVDGEFLFDRQRLSLLLANLHVVELKVGQVELSGQLCDGFCCYLESPDTLANASSSHRFFPLRSFLLRESEVAFQFLGACVQLGHWLNDHQFCGRCARPLVMRDDDRALYCAPCNHRYYPRVSPCVIMLVTMGRRCLLAVHKRAHAQIFTALAGFIEAGETLEQAVAREVEEEVGIKISLCEYVASQPWPFPGQLMMGFFAEAAQGSAAIDLQDDEISEAHWFDVDQLPELIPPEQTLSGQLIRRFAERCRKG